MPKINFFEPDFSNSNLNISATLAEFLGANNENATIPELKAELEKDYKNVIFICFDGMGMLPLELNLCPDSLLRKKIVKTLVSTFPSTTTTATTSLLTNKLPLEHGWLGWNLHFEEVHKNIDLYSHKDSQTGEHVDYVYPMGENLDYYFDNACTDYEINTAFMPYVSVKYPNRNYKINNEVELCDALRKIIAKPNKQFVYAYIDDPDSVMHFHGVSSQNAKEKIERINAEIEKLYNECEDTLFIITADHGQVDINGYVEFYKDLELNAMLECESYLDARVPAFKVKAGMKSDFEKRFAEKYGEDFKLFRTQELLDKGYFGSRGEFGYLLGDYIAVGTFTNKQFLWNENKTRYLGHHTSLTDEMFVPLILLQKK